jgi:hypothetical protein
MVGGMTYGAWLLVAGAWRVFRTLDSSVAVSVISASAAIVVSTITVVIGKARDARLMVEKETREKKIPVYEELIRFMLRVLMGSKTGEAPSELEILKFFADFTQKMMVWGADGVVKSWVEFRRFSVDENGMAKDPFRGMLLYEAVVRAIRKDLGHQNTGLKEGDILGLFINDAHTLVSERKASKKTDDTQPAN